MQAQALRAQLVVLAVAAAQLLVSQSRR